MKLKNLSLFWRCFFTFLISTLIFLCVQIYSFRKTSALWQKSYTEQVQSSLLHNAEALSNDLYSFYYLPKIMNVSRTFHDLSYLTGINTAEHSRFVTSTMNDLSDQLEYFNPAFDIIIHMRKSDICVTPYTFYMTSGECLSSYKYTNRDIPAEVLKKEARNHSLEMFPCSEIYIRERTGCEFFTCALKESADVCTYIVLIEKNRLLDYFQLDSLPDSIYFRLYNSSDGRVLAEYGAAPEEPGTKNGNSGGRFVSMTADIPVINASASISIPKSYFESVTREAQRNVYVLLLLSLALALFLCMIFSQINVQPVQDLIKAQQIPKEKQSSNELVTIYNYLSESKEQNKSMKDKIVSNLLVKAFSGIPLTEDDFSYLSSNTELFSESARIAVARYKNAPDKSEYQSMMLYQLKHNMPGSFIIEPLNRQEIGIVLPSNEDAVFTLKGYIDGINNELEEKSRIICGVSAPFNGIDSVADAVQQALFSLPEGANCFVIFNNEENDMKPQTHMPDFKEFQSALFSWNIREIETLLSAYADAVIRENAASAQEIFYTLLTIIKDAATAVKIPQDFFNECRYARSISGEANITALKVLVDYLFEQKANIQSDEKLLRNREIINYINTHYDDSMLNATVIAGMHGLSERTINTILNDETGMSFANYLTQIRMKNAGAMLRDTTLEAAEVAEKCGLTVSTFYRNFKKFYHMTPAEYKAQFIENKA
ncbi:MAG: AraC family transcriptional regulator [Lachnospiraceae bacterium]|nr:AraC family transcriptional regulator [Lachnospiraceae bacterium]